MLIMMTLYFAIHLANFHNHLLRDELRNNPLIYNVIRVLGLS